jgi:fatty-acyl-CoA synthase
MTCYFEDPAATSDVLSEDGWLNTGDLGYRVGKSLIITGREKVLIIIIGRNIWPQDLEYLAEQQLEVRTGDASAFSVTSPNGEERAVLVIECRESDPDSRRELSERLRSLVYQDLGIDAFVELVPRNTLPRTTSGKLSRSGARADFLKRTSGREVMFVQAESGTGSFAKQAI